MSGLRLLHPNRAYQLITGAVLYSALSDDAGGLVFIAHDGVEYVLRDSTSGGRPCTALVQRLSVDDGDQVAVSLVPSDFVLEDLRELPS